MATEIDKLFKGFSIKEIEEILFTAVDGVKKTKKKIPIPVFTQAEIKVKQRLSNWEIYLQTNKHTILPRNSCQENIPI